MNDQLLELVDRDAPLQRVDPVDGWDVQRVSVALALWFGRCRAAEPSERARFEQVLGPPPPGAHWPLDVRFRILPDGTVQGISTCEMVVAGFARLLGIDCPSARRPYHTGEGIAPLETCARQHGAWRSPATGDLDRFPGPGHWVRIGRGRALHACTVVGYGLDDDGARTIISVDGGLEDPEHERLQRIGMCERKLWLHRQQLYLGGRPVRGWIAVEAMPRSSDRCTAPSDWRKVRSF